MSNFKLIRVIRDPADINADIEQSAVDENIRLVADVHEALPPPNRFPFFLVDFEYKGKPYQMKFGLELEGRDAEWEPIETMNDDEDMEVSEEAINAIYFSKAWADANTALDQAPASFWK